jgi:anti-sigma B factor antagonist
MNPNYIHNTVDRWTVIEFRCPSLMDPPLLESMQADLIRLVEIEDRRNVILDFAKVQYVSSQAIGIVIHMHKKLTGLTNSKLVLCGVPPKIMELLKILKLERILTIVPTQKEAVAIMAK